VVVEVVLAVGQDTEVQVVVVVVEQEHMLVQQVQVILVAMVVPITQITMQEMVEVWTLTYQEMMETQEILEMIEVVMDIVQTQLATDVVAVEEVGMATVQVVKHLVLDMVLQVDIITLLELMQVDMVVEAVAFIIMAMTVL
tara:strand:- start:76 stop:498 length:423 start_codon:yes stop_codon:yes gene_type:complete